MSDVTQMTVEDVVRRMRAIGAGLDPTDGVSVFNRMYLEVTEQVLARLRTGSTFRDGAFMSALDVHFARLWFAAHDARVDAVPRAWAPLFEGRRRPGILPIQFALAGMNTHIEHDLPLAVVATCVERRTEPTAPGVREDYERVNDLLAAVEAGIRRSFLDEAGRAVDDRFGPAVHLVSSWNIDKARDVAWATTLTLWEMRGHELLSDVFRSGLAHTVGMASRLLLLPLDGDAPD